MGNRPCPFFSVRTVEITRLPSPFDHRYRLKSLARNRVSQSRTKRTCINIVPSDRHRQMFPFCVPRNFSINTLLTQTPLHNFSADTLLLFRPVSWKPFEASALIVCPSDRVSYPSPASSFSSTLRPGVKNLLSFFFLPTAQADAQERKGRCEKWDIRNGAVNKEAEEEQNKKRHFGFLPFKGVFFTHHSPRLPPHFLFRLHVP